MAEEWTGAIPKPSTAAADGAGAGQWQRTLLAMVGIQFIMTMAFSVLSPIMPLLLPELGVRPRAGSRSWAGILDGVTSFVAAFASPVWGRVADRHGRKTDVVALQPGDWGVHLADGCGGECLAVFCVSGADGVFAGFSSAAIALFASQVPERRLGYALGWLSTGRLVGSLVGPLIGRALADLTGSHRIPFYCTSATILLAMGLVWIAVDERFAAPPPARRRGSILGSLIAVASAPSAGAFLHTADGAIRRAHGTAGGDLIRSGAARRAARYRHPERHRLFGDRARECHLPHLFSATAATRSAIGGCLLICLMGATLTTLPQAFTSKLLGLHRPALRCRVVHRRYSADRQCAGRAPRPARRTRTVYGITASAVFLGNSLGR